MRILHSPVSISLFCKIALIVVVIVFAAFESPAQEITFFAEQTDGAGNAIVRIDVVDPAQTTGDRYQVTFSKVFGDFRFSVENLNTQVVHVVDLAVGTTSTFFEGIQVTANELPPQFRDIVEVQYGNTAVDPPAPVFRPGDGRGNSGVNSTGEYTFVAGTGDGSLNFISRSVDNATPYDYEIRFDGNPEGRNKFIHSFTGQGTIDVPFSVWNIGIATPDDTTDDQQIIAIGFDDSSNPSVYDGGALPRDGGPGDMFDRIYLYSINHQSLAGDINNDGVVNYNDVLQDIENNGGDISTIIRRRAYLGPEGLSRFSLVNLTDDPNYLPPVGTSIRITTSKPITEQDIFEFVSLEFGLVITPHPLDFFGVKINKKRTVPLNIVNTTNSAIQVSNISVDSPTFQVSRTNFTLEPAGSTTVDITFTPMADGIVEATVTILSNDQFFPVYKIKVMGDGLPASGGTIDILGRMKIEQNGVARQDVADIWGYHDTNTGKEYALVGYGIFTNPPNAGVSIVDVSDPSRPSEVANVNSVPGFDIKVWQNYLYSVNGNSLGGILDISDPANPQNVGSFTGSHNMFISDDGYMYQNCPGLNIYDLNTDPTNPTLVWSDNISSCHDAAVIGDRLYNFHGSSGTFIYDVANPANPVLLGAIEDPTIAYNHSGWPTEDGNYLFICDELAKHPTADFSVWDISDLANPERVADFAHPNATIHNLYIIDDFAYVSYYTNGYWIFDVSNPIQPVALDSFDTAPDLTGEGFNGAFGVYPFSPSGNIFVSDEQSGLHVFAPLNLTSVRTNPPGLPDKYILGENYPNPFNPETTIKYQLARTSQVKIEIYNIIGHNIRSLVDAKQERGSYSVKWDGRSDSGRQAPSGIYFYRMTTEGFAETKRLLLLR